MKISKKSNKLITMKKLVKVLTFIICISFFSCNYSQKQNDTIKVNKTLEESISKGDYYLGVIDESFYINKIDSLDFKDAKIKIIKISNPRFIDSSPKSKKHCVNWKISPKEIQIFFQQARFSSKNEMMKKFYWEPCEVEINLSINNVDYVFILNKGYVGKLIYGNKSYNIVNDLVLD